MERCQNCRRFTGEPRQPKVGERVDFTIVKGNGRSMRMSVRTGKLMLIKDDGFSVIYRGTVYHADAVSCPDEPSDLTLSFVGMCDCNKDSVS